MGFQAVGNFKFKGKLFKSGDKIPEKMADGKPFAEAKEMAMLVSEGHVIDESKITASQLAHLENQIVAKRAELAALESALEKKKPAAAPKA